MDKEIFLLLGTNQGDKNANLLNALSAIEAGGAGKIKKRSGVYQTAAWGKQDQEVFYNLAIEIETDCSPQELLQKLLTIEEQLGRVRAEKWGPRLIDIDILLFANGIIKEERLVIPHPRMQDRKFALMPLCEIAPDFVHPQYLVSIKTLLIRCQDALEVARISD